MMNWRRRKHSARKLLMELNVHAVHWAYEQGHDVWAQYIKREQTFGRWQTFKIAATFGAAMTVMQTGIRAVTKEAARRGLTARELRS